MLLHQERRKRRYHLHQTIPSPNGRGAGRHTHGSYAGRPPGPSAYQRNRGSALPYRDIYQQRTVKSNRSAAVGRGTPFLIYNFFLCIISLVIIKLETYVLY